MICFAEENGFLAVPYAAEKRNAIEWPGKHSSPPGHKYTPIDDIILSQVIARDADGQRSFRVVGAKSPSL